MKKYLLLISACILSLGLNAQGISGSSYTFTIEDCISYALDKNYNKQQLKLSEESKEASLSQAKSERLPSLNATVSENFKNTKSDHSWNGSYGISTDVTLFQGGAINNTIEQSKLEVEQAAYQTAQYENDLTIQILQSFISILGNDELLKYQQAVIKTSKEQLNQGKEQFKVGQILESDYLMLEAQYANDLNSIVDTEIARNNNLITLKGLLSMEPSADLQIIHPDTSAIDRVTVLPNQEYVVERTMAYLPDLKVSQYNVAIATLGIKQSQSSYYPTISLGASIGTGHTKDYSNFGTQLSDQLNEQVGLTLSIPIFNKNRTKTNVAKSRIALKQAELDKLQTELTVKQSITQEYQNLVSALNKYNVTDIRQNAYKKTFEAYSAQFNVGSITVVDLLQQQNNYISALNDYIQSKYSFILLRKVLDVYMGEQVSM